MSDDKKPETPSLDQDTLLEFPCDFQVKAMGLTTDSFEQLVLEIVRNHVEELTEAAAKSRESSNGKYLSVSISITATSKIQLDNIYIELSAHELVLMAL